MYINNSLTTINLPCVEKVGEHFLGWNDSLTSISLPKLKEHGRYFLDKNTHIKSININTNDNIQLSFLLRVKQTLERLKKSK